MTINFDYSGATENAELIQRPGQFQRDHPYQDGIKRGLDVLLILLTLPLSLTAIALAALAILLTGQKPFYVQKRIGRHGRVFRMMKLQTMCAEPDRRLVEYLETNAHAADEWRVKQKLVHDPRVTPLGRLLRRSSLDELPQIWNVLRGDMAIVGPRPMMVEQRLLYPGQAYYRMRPGITGPWQVSDRNQSEFSARSRFDALYDLHQSPVLDLSIMFRTVFVMLRQTGC